MTICTKLKNFEQLLPPVDPDQETVTNLWGILSTLIYYVSSLLYLSPEEIAWSFFVIHKKRLHISVELKYVFAALLC